MGLWMMMMMNGGGKTKEEEEEETSLGGSNLCLGRANYTLAKSQDISASQKIVSFKCVFEYMSIVCCI